MTLVKALLATFFVSMLPVIELRGGIPFGVGLDLTVWQSFGAALAGNIVIGLVIIALLEPILKGLQKTKFFARISQRIAEKFKTKAGKIKQSNKIWGIAAFVGVPLPLTGVWTGAAIAVFSGLPFWAAALACTAGIIIAGFIILGITILFASHTAIIFDVFLVFAIILAAAFLIYIFMPTKEKAGKIPPEPVQ